MKRLKSLVCALVARIRSRPILTAIGLFLVVGFGWVFFVDDNGDLPVYQGKTVEEWFYGEKGHFGSQKTRQVAEAVFEDMGPDCVPFLIQNLRKRETWVSESYRNIHSKLPDFIQTRTRPPRAVSYLQTVTLSHLRKLPDSALDFHAPELMAAALGIQDPNTRYQGFYVIQYVALRGDPHEKTAFFAALLKDPDFRLQFQAAVMLAGIDKTFTDGIPILIEGVTNRTLMTSSFPQPNFAFMQRRPPVIPDQAMILQKAAHIALARVSPALAEKHAVKGPVLPTRAEVPTLIRALSSSDSKQRVRAGTALEKLFASDPQALRRNQGDRVLNYFALQAAVGGQTIDVDVTEALARVETAGGDWDNAIQSGLKDPFERVRLVAIHRLGSRGDQNVSAESLRLLVDARAETGLDILNAVSKAIRGLRKNGAPIDEQLDLALARAPKFENQLGLIHETELATAEAVKTLRAILGSGSAAQKVRSAELLRQRAKVAASAVPELIEALKSAAGELRYQAVLALSDLGPEAMTAAPALEAALNDDGVMVQNAARRALGRIRE